MEQLPHPPRQLAPASSVPAKTTGQEPPRTHAGWIPLSRLPGYATEALRLAGRQLFATFTRVPLERVEVISTLTAAPRAFAQACKEAGADYTLTSPLRLQFHQLFPGYTADVVPWRCRDWEGLVVQDAHGQYVYRWPHGGGLFGRSGNVSGECTERDAPLALGHLTDALTDLCREAGSDVHAYAVLKRQRA